MHKRLALHLKKIDLNAPGGQSALLELVDQAYREHDLEWARSDRSNLLMQEELEALNQELQASTAAMEIQNLRFQAAQDNMPQALSLFDKHGNLAICNRRFREMYQLEESYHPIGRPLTEILVHCAAHGLPVSPERRLLSLAHGSMTIDKASVLEQAWPDGRIVSIARNTVPDGGYLDTTSDITEARRILAQIARMAHYDPLTDLPNRSLFRERLVEASHHASRGELTGVVCLDLDRFKAVNDTFGHPTGDALLVEVSRRLVTHLRASDTVARLGGDEFVMILRQLRSIDDVHLVAQRIIDHVGRPYLLEGHSVSIGVSIGISIMDKIVNNPDQSVSTADVALYQAKAAGRGVFRVLRPELNALAD